MTKGGSCSEANFVVFIPPPGSQSYGTMDCVYNVFANNFSGPQNLAWESKRVVSQVNLSSSLNVAYDGRTITKRRKNRIVCGVAWMS